MSYSLAPFSEVLGIRKAKHLLRRATYNYSKETLNTFAGMTAIEAVSFLSEIQQMYLKLISMIQLMNIYLMLAKVRERLL